MLGSILGLAGLASDVFGIGGNSQQQQSQTNRDAFSQSSGSTFVDSAQQPYLDFLRNTGMNMVNQQQAGLGNLFGVSQGLQGQGQSFLGQLGGVQAPGAVNPVQAASVGPVAGQLSGFGGQGIVDAQIGQLGSDLGALFQNQINPAIRRDATAAGALGGGRQQVAQGVAAGELGRAFAGGATDIMRNAEQQRLQAMGQQAGLQTQAALANAAYQQQAGLANQTAALQGQGFGLQAAGMNQQGAMAGLSALPSLFGLAQSPFQAQLNPLMAYASMLGGPTILSQQRARSQDTTRSSSSGSGRGFDFNSSFGFFE